jgi:chemotaxis protein methyltransferase WspC
VKRIENLLNREIGLSARSIGAGAVEAAAKARMRACGVSELGQYLERLQGDAAERVALVEEVVVSETWFFRDEEVFKGLRRHAVGWRGTERTLRLLSIPCATGEEAYSASICLLEAGLRPPRFSIRAVDVSERALSLAVRASYGKNSFRSVSPAEHASFFEGTESGFRVTDAAKGPVQFSRGNVLDPLLVGARSFDVILCRNLLIYLDAPARKRALDNLCNWLVEGGVLFGGHAESVERMDNRFERLPELGHFAYLKQRAERGQRASTPARRRTSVRPSPAQHSAERKRTSSSRPALAPKLELAESRASLERATELANRGELSAARSLCERFIAEVGASPEAYCLLGIISNAAGDRDAAMACFNKSLYLNQAHHEALVHLALLHEQRGDLPAAANFRRRAERARGGEPK